MALGEIRAFAQGEASLSFSVESGRVILDSGVADLVRGEEGQFGPLDLLPPIVGQTEVASQRFDCADCPGAQACLAARAGAAASRAEGLVYASSETDFSYPISPEDRERAVSAREDLHSERIGAIERFEEASQDGSCPGGRELTVETTYETWGYIDAGEGRFGARRQQAMRALNRQFATHTRTVTVCGNPEPINPIESF